MRETPYRRLRFLWAIVIAFALAAWAMARIASRPTLPRLALIIDDFGYAPDSLVNQYDALGVPLTAAVLPYQPFSASSAEAAHRAGMEVILHFPMEGAPGSDLGPDALLGALSERELRARTRKALGDVPRIAGANNHMGSSLSADTLRMRCVLEEVARGGHVFVDSRTTERTGEAIAIGHVYPEKLAALRELIPAATGRVEFVRVGKLVR